LTCIQKDKITALGYLADNASRERKQQEKNTQANIREKENFPFL